MSNCEALEKVRAITAELLKDKDWSNLDGIRWDKIAESSNTNTFPEIQHEGETHTLLVESYSLGEDEVSSEAYVVFEYDEFPNRYWQVKGHYDSWDSEIKNWTPVEELFEVEPVAVVRYIYKPVQK